MKKILVIASTMLFGFINVHAAMTTAGTEVANTATLSYTVGAATRTETSNEDKFIVDKKVDVLVVNNSNTNTEVAPGDTQAVIQFDVANEGNKDQAFTFPVQDNVAGDDFDVSGCKVFHNGTDVTAGMTIPQESNVTLEVRCDIPNTVTNGQLSNIILTADSGETNTAGEDNQLVEDVVLADDTGATDADKDGKHSAAGTYEVKAAVIDLTKLSCVLSDPVNGVNVNAKRIPGAKVVYVFDINNTGSSAASGLSISDTLAAELDGAVTNVKLISNTGNTPCNCANGQGNTVGGTASTPANTGAGQTVTVDAGTIDAAAAGASNHSCLSFEAEIK